MKKSISKPTRLTYVILESQLITLIGALLDRKTKLDRKSNNNNNKNKMK